MCMAGMNMGMNMGMGAGTQSGGNFPASSPVQYTAANAPPDPSTVPMPQSRPQIDPEVVVSPDQKTKVEDNATKYPNTDDSPRATNVTNVNPGDYKNEIEYDKDGLPIRRKKGN